MQSENRPLADLMRPSTIDEIVGQSQLLGENGLVRRMVDNHKLSNLILWGPPGCGKTTIARALAKSVDMDFVPMSAVFSGTADIKKAMDAAKMNREIGRGTLLFIDEIHRLRRAVEEILYSAMEDYKLDIVIGKGPAARSVRLDLPRFTVIGATTRTGSLAGPLRDRFGIIHRLEYYKIPEINGIHGSLFQRRV